MARRDVRMLQARYSILGRESLERKSDAGRLRYLEMAEPAPLRQVVAFVVVECELFGREVGI